MAQNDLGLNESIENNDINENIDTSDHNMLESLGLLTINS